MMRIYILLFAAQTLIWAYAEPAELRCTCDYDDTLDCAWLTNRTEACHMTGSYRSQYLAYGSQCDMGPPADGERACRMVFDIRYTMSSFHNIRLTVHCGQDVPLETSFLVSSAIKGEPIKDLAYHADNRTLIWSTDHELLTDYNARVQWKRTIDESYESRLLICYQERCSYTLPDDLKPGRYQARVQWNPQVFETDLWSDWSNTAQWSHGPPLYTLIHLLRNGIL